LAASLKFYWRLIITLIDTEVDTEHKENFEKVSQGPGLILTHMEMFGDWLWSV